MVRQYESEQAHLIHYKAQTINSFFENWRLSTVDEGRKEIIKKIEKEVATSNDFEFTSILNEMGALMAFCINDNQRAIKFISSNLERNPNEKRYSEVKNIFYKDMEKNDNNILEYYEILKLLGRTYEDNEISNLLNIVRPKYKYYLEKYINNFVLIDPTKRKYIYLQENIGGMPNVIKVLPLSQELPGIKFMGEGHPKDNQLYVKHPLKSDTYIPFETYDFELFRDQLDEFKFIMGSIGAKRISYTILNDKNTVTTEHKDFGGEVRGEYMGNSGNVRYDQETDSKRIKNLKQKYEVNAGYFPRTQIEMPDTQDLTWYNYNEEWQRKVSSRMSGKKKNEHFIISISSENKVSDSEKHELELDINYLTLNANVKANYANKISHHIKQINEWNVEVEFYPLNKSVFRIIYEYLKRLFVSDN